MSLWGRVAGTIFLALILIVACKEDETSLLGFKNPSNKFKVSYVEIPLTSSVMRFDSLRTFTDPNQTLDRRLLVGKYTDNQFGELTAEAYTQFGPLSPTVTIPATAVVASAYLVLSYDFYYYGDRQTSESVFTVHELLDSIPPTDPADLPLNIRRVANYQPYFSNTSLPYDPTPIGTASLQIDPEVFDKTRDDLKNNPGELDHKTIDTLEIQLKDEFAVKLFDFARGQSADYKNQRKFRRIFKGLVIRPGAGDKKIIGFNPQIDSTAFTKSRLIINYDEIDASNGDKTRKVLEYSIYKLSQNTVAFNFSNISAERGGTPLALLTQPNIESELDGNRYYQSGNPITTKIDFDNFLAFADTIPTLIFNSVQLSIDVDDAEVFSPPSTLRLRYLNSSNEFLNFYSDVPSDIQFPIYPASMTQDEQGWFIIGQRLNTVTVGSLFDIKYNASNRQYTGDLTDYFQTLFNIKQDEFRYTKFALSASIPHEGVSVNRMVFNKNNLKLKIFYTIPSYEK